MKLHFSDIFFSLSENLKQTKETKSSLKTEIQSKQKYLDSLQPMLNNILQVGVVYCLRLGVYVRVVVESLNVLQRTQASMRDIACACTCIYCGVAVAVSGHQASAGAPGHAV